MKTGILSEQPREAVEQEPGSDQQDERERGFGDDERIAKPGRAGCVDWGSALENRIDIGVRGGPRRYG